MRTRVWMRKWQKVNVQFLPQQHPSVPALLRVCLAVLNVAVWLLLRVLPAAEAKRDSDASAEADRRRLVQESINKSR